jgi:nucleoid-associated protein YgaU
MSRETRIALLVALGFIVLFGLVLGQRSLSLSARTRQEDPSAGVSPPPPGPGPEVLAASRDHRQDRSAPTSGSDRAAPPGGQDRSGGDVPVAGTTRRLDLVAREGERRQEPPAGGDRAAEEAREPGPRLEDQRPPAPPEEVRRPPAMTYTVGPGDTLIGIARKVYGRQNETLYPRIFEANRDKLASPARLPVGLVLVIPALEPVAPRPEAPAGVRRPHYAEMGLGELERRLGRGRTYVVQTGDCLTDIARRQMGDATRSAVQRLLELNRDRVSDPDRLPVGLTLRLPDGA